LFLAATIVAAAINALAGGGGLITFPLLSLALSPVSADATSAVALFTAYPNAVWRARHQLAGVPRRWVWLLLIHSVLGGLLGALLLNWTGDRNFGVLVPWLMLGSTLLLLLQPLLVPRQSANRRHPSFTRLLQPMAVLVTLVVAI
jgi:uncharacterized membrane protein YfcA